MNTLKRTINNTIKCFGFIKIGDRRGLVQYAKEIDPELSLSILITNRKSFYPVVEIGILHKDLNINYMGKDLYDVVGLPGITFSKCVIDTEFKIELCERNDFLFISELNKHICLLVESEKELVDAFYRSMETLENLKIYNGRTESDFFFIAILYKAMKNIKITDIISECRARLLNKPLELNNFDFKLKKSRYINENLSQSL